MTQRKKDENSPKDKVTRPRPDTSPTEVDDGGESLLQGMPREEGSEAAVEADRLAEARFRRAKEPESKKPDD